MKKFIINILVFGSLISFWSCSDDSLDPTLSQSKDLLTNLKTISDLNTAL